MRILFIHSGNKQSGISTIIKNQGISLSNLGKEVDYFPLIGKGISGYLSNIPKLNKILKAHKFDIIHAHYSLSGFVASLAGAKPLVVSLMGSDVSYNQLSRLIIRLFIFIFGWKYVILKSEDSKTKLGLKNSIIIPNGIDLEHFISLNKDYCREKLKWKKFNKIILFTADPVRPEKNFILAREAFQLVDDKYKDLMVLGKVPFKEMPFYFNASDVILLTSLWEGSPNVIKEAMACNRPIVSVDVGDVRELTEGIPGCFIANNNPEDIADKIKQALEYNHSIGARQRIIDRGLEINETARKIIAVYEKVLLKKSQTTNHKSEMTNR